MRARTAARESGSPGGNPRDDLAAAVIEAGVVGHLAEALLAEPGLTAQLLREQTARDEARGKGPALVARNAIARCRGIEARLQRRQDVAQRIESRRRQAVVVGRRESEACEVSVLRMERAIAAMSPAFIVDLLAAALERLPHLRRNVRSDDPVGSVLASRMLRAAVFGESERRGEGNGDYEDRAGVNYAGPITDAAVKGRKGP